MDDVDGAIELDEKKLDPVVMEMQRLAAFAPPVVKSVDSCLAAITSCSAG